MFTAACVAYAGCSNGRTSKASKPESPTLLPRSTDAGHAASEGFITSEASKPHVLVPGPKLLKDAADLYVRGGTLVIWNALYAAEAKMRGSELIWSNTVFDATNTVALFVAQDGTRLQWLRRIAPAPDGSTSLDSVAFYPEGAPARRWEAGKILWDVYFTDTAAFALRDDALLRIDRFGSKTVKSGLKRYAQILLADDTNYVVCRGQGGGEPTIDDDDFGANCQSSEGWTFGGDWFQHRPILCGQQIIQFKTKGIETKWSALIYRALRTGEVVHTTKAVGGKASCIHSLVVDQESGRTWGQDGSQQAPLLCGGKSALLWGKGNPAWCLAKDGVLHPVDTRVDD